MLRNLLECSRAASQQPALQGTDVLGGIGDMRKKVNPRRRPATQADVNKAKKEAIDEAVKLAWSIMMTVLVDKEGYDLDDLRRVWDEVNNLSDSVAKGYCTVQDLRQILKLEVGANIE